jgi:hypothetical protein
MNILLGKNEQLALRFEKDGIEYLGVRVYS